MQSYTTWPPNAKPAILPALSPVTTQFIANWPAKLGKLRVFAMASVVWGHALISWGKPLPHTSFAETCIIAAAMQLGRFGTVIFFVISGFFLAAKLQQFTVRTYLAYRLRSLIIPWLVFVCLCVVLGVLQSFSLQQIMQMPAQTKFVTLFHFFTGAIFHAAYWFIPVAILSSCLLVSLKKYIFAWWLTLLLLACTIFYSVNLYHGWISVYHTKSLPGYAVFILLGVMLQAKPQPVYNVISSLPWKVIALCLAGTFILSCVEGQYLTARGCNDAYASIRGTNILLSLIIITAFLKANLAQVATPHAEKYTFGIYLVHSILLLQVTPLLRQFVLPALSARNWALLLAIQLAVFIAVYALSLGMVIILKNTPLKFVVGR